MKSVPYVLVGGGLAAAHAIDTLIKEGVAGSDILLIGAEPELPYNRPPLSKRFLLEKESRESVFVKPASFYEQHGIRVLRTTRATTVDTAARAVTLSSGETVSYTKLLIATGSTPRRLSVPGSDLPGIFTLRTLADSERIKDAMTRAKTAVVVGGGFIGMELASAFAQKNLTTTILHRGTAVFDKLGSPEISAFFEKLYRDRGVDIRYEDEAVGFDGSDHVTAVRTKKGETLPADLVAVGIGVVPETDALKDSGMVMENGVKVNEYMETSAPDVYAAGDVALFFDPLYGKHRRIEHWDTAIQHGKVAGANMAGKREPYGAVSYFFSDIFDLSYDYYGDAAETDTTVTRGSFDEKAVTIFYLRGNIVRAAFTMERPKERKQTIALIKSKASVDTNTLADISKPLPPT